MWHEFLPGLQEVCCVNRERIMSLEKKLSSFMFMHYILEYSTGRDLAWSWSLGPGSFWYRLHLIIANSKVFTMTFCSEKQDRNQKRCPLCATDLNGTVSPPFPECFVWSKWEFGRESGAACEGGLRNWEWRCHLIGLKLCGVLVPVSLFRD